MERAAPTNDWSPPPAEPSHRPEPVERPAAPPLAANSDMSGPSPGGEERGSN
jgi:hypothetical protein